MSDQYSIFKFKGVFHKSEVKYDGSTRMVIDVDPDAIKELTDMMKLQARNRRLYQVVMVPCTPEGDPIHVSGLD